MLNACLHWYVAKRFTFYFFITSLVVNRIQQKFKKENQLFPLWTLADPAYVWYMRITTHWKYNKDCDIKMIFVDKKWKNIPQNIRNFPIPYAIFSKFLKSCHSNHKYIFSGLLGLPNALVVFTSYLVVNLVSEQMWAVSEWYVRSFMCVCLLHCINP